MMNELISVIVPVYKAEKALPRCIESIQKQSYQNLEIILIDDGSPDKCPKICDKYAKKDERIKVIHQKNGGLCRARNVGILRAGGVYLCFCDDDDVMPRNSIEKMYHRINETNADFVCGNYTLANKTIKSSVSSSWRSTEYFVSDGESLSRFFRDCGNPYFTPWGKLYRKDILWTHKIVFLPEMVMGEDTHFVYNYLRHCEKIATISDNIYYWCRFGETSESRNYHENHNKCHYINQRLRLEFFDQKKLPLNEQIAILEYFWITLRVYVRFLPKEEGSCKLQETCEMFTDILALVNNEQVQKSEEKYAKNYYEYVRFIESDDYGSLYDYIAKKEKVNLGMKAKLRKIGRSILHPAYRFMVYRLKWFYKN